MKLRSAILKTLLYFDIFDYPLKVSELHSYLPIEASQDLIQSKLLELILEKDVFKFGEYYSVRNSLDTITKRLQTNALASELKGIAFDNAKLITRFPFVRSVSISGSMSKGVMHEDGDIDYFIISKSGRVWISRAFLVLYKRIVLKNSRARFCINYFVGDKNLKIPEENIFTAIELSSLIPVTGYQYYKNLLDANAWFLRYIHNFEPKKISISQHVERSFLSRTIEKLSDNKLGSFLDTTIMKIFNKRNAKKYGAGLAAKKFELMYRSNPNQAKIHPEDHQAKILNLYAKRISDFGILKIEANG